MKLLGLKSLGLSSLALASLAIHSASAAPETEESRIFGLIEKGDKLMQKSRDRVDSTLYFQAERFYRKAFYRDSDNTSAMLGLAWVHSSDHEFVEGRRWAESALEIDPELVDAYSLIGDIELELGRYEAAVEAYQKALDLKPDLSTYSRAAVLAWTLGDEILGQQLMELAISSGAPHTENAAWCRARLALMLFDQGKLDEGLALVGSAAEAAPDNPFVLTIQGKLLQASGDSERAIEVFARSVQINPTHDALASLVSLYQAEGFEKKTKNAYKSLLRYHTSHHHVESDHGHRYGHSHGHHDLASAELALFWADLGMNLDGAVDAAELAYHLYPNIRSADALAWSYYKTGHYDKASRLAEKAISLGTPQAELYYHVGMIEYANGDLEKSRLHLERAISLNPNFDAEGIRTIRATLKKLTNA